MTKALEIINETDLKGNPKPFDIMFCKKNGELVRLKKCIKTGYKHNMKSRNLINIKSLRSPDKGYVAVYIPLIFELNGKAIPHL